MNQKGFATLEVILMVVVIGILATVAVPRFTSITTKANTAKIQSDLSTIDTAISIYYMEHGQYPAGLSNLSDYIRDVDKLAPPTGSAYINGEEKKIDATAYLFKEETTGEKRAALDGHTAGDFYQPKRT